MKARSLVGTLALLGVGSWLASGCGGDSDVFGSGSGTETSSGTATGTGTGSTSSGSGGSTSSGSGGSTSSGSGGSSSGSGGAGAGGSGIGDPCNWDLSDCGAGLYCDAAGCQDGTCQPILPIDGQAKDFAPICGCDGVSYFNFSVASSHGMAMLHSDRCNADQSQICHPQNNPCPDGTICNMQLDNPVGCLSPNDKTGLCWGVPDSCDPDFPNAPEGRPCGSPASPCLDACTLMTAQQPWYLENWCF